MALAQLSVRRAISDWHEAGDVVTRKFYFLGMSRWAVSASVQTFMGGKYQTCVNKPNLGGCGQEKSKLAQWTCAGVENNLNGSTRVPNLTLRRGTWTHCPNQVVAGLLTNI